VGYYPTINLQHTYVYVARILLQRSGLKLTRIWLNIPSQVLLGGGVGVVPDAPVHVYSKPEMGMFKREIDYIMWPRSHRTCTEPCTFTSAAPFGLEWRLEAQERSIPPAYFTTGATGSLTNAMPNHLKTAELGRCNNDEAETSISGSGRSPLGVL